MSADDLLVSSLSSRQIDNLVKVAGEIGIAITPCIIKRAMMKPGGSPAIELQPEQQAHYDRGTQRCFDAWRRGVIEAIAVAMVLDSIYHQPPSAWLVEAVKAEIMSRFHATGHG